MASSYLALLLLLAWPLQVAAFIEFSPNCTTIPPHVNFVASSPYRSTMDIFWSCFAVLTTCTYAIQHLCVPNEPPVYRKPWHAWLAKTFFFVDFNKMWWMGLALFLPEYLLGKAVAEFFAARQSVAEFANRDEWTLTHAYFSNMRGFALRFQVAAVPTDLTPRPPDDLQRSRQKASPAEIQTPYYEQDEEEAEQIELEQCRKICGVPCKNRDWSVEWHDDGEEDERKKPDGGDTAEAHVPEIKVKDTPANKTQDQDQIQNSAATAPPPSGTDEKQKQEPNSKPSGTVVTTSDPDEPAPKDKVARLCPHQPWTALWALTSEQWIYAYRQGLISKPPEISQDDLQDRSKGDSLVKLITVGQLGWLIIQIIARAIQGLEIALLEIMAVAFSVCAMLIYLLLLYKPQDVGVSIKVDATRMLTRRDIINLAARSPVSSLFVNGFWLHGVAVRVMADNIFPSTQPITIKIPRTQKTSRFFYFNSVLVGIGVGGMTFAAIHFAAWNFMFPTLVEQLLWRISCVIVCALPMISTSIYCTTQIEGRALDAQDSTMNKIMRPFGYLLAPIYLVARLYLLVEVVRGLAYPQPSLFQSVNWSLYLPHIA